MMLQYTVSNLLLHIFQLRKRERGEKTERRNESQGPSSEEEATGTDDDDG